MQNGCRTEKKYLISLATATILRARLLPLMRVDSQAVHGAYRIRSLYFDTPDADAFWEKVDGWGERCKYRLRFYNGDTSFIQLEKKSKVNGLGTKFSAPLTKEEAQALVDGDLDWMLDSGRPLVQELYSKMRSQGIMPKTIVDYTREPFIYAPGNVRVTFDYDIRTGLLCTDFLSPDCVTIPAGDAPILMEVKWDEFLPSVIRDIGQMPGRHSTAFSKYAQCRIYG